jgi:hypothetical protein
MVISATPKVFIVRKKLWKNADIVKHKQSFGNSNEGRDAPMAADPGAGSAPVSFSWPTPHRPDPALIEPQPKRLVACREHPCPCPASHA